MARPVRSAAAAGLRMVLESLAGPPQAGWTFGGARGCLWLTGLAIASTFLAVMAAVVATQVGKRSGVSDELGATIAMWAFLGVLLASGAVFWLVTRRRKRESADTDDAEPVGGTRTKRVLLLFGLVIAIGIVLFVGLSLLGAQVAEELRGTIEFGTAGSGCGVEGRASSFPAGTSVHYAAYLARQIPANSTLTLRITRDRAEVASVDRSFDSAGDCLAGVVPGVIASAGHYRFEWLIGTETMSAGEFDVTPVEGDAGTLLPTATASEAEQGDACGAYSADGEPVPHEDPALESVLPDFVDSVPFCKRSFRPLSNQSGDDQNASHWLLEQFGKTDDDYSIAQAYVAGRATTSGLVGLEADRLAGADGEAFLSAYIAWAFPDATVATVVLEGRTVTTVSSEDTTLYFFARGDTVFCAIGVDDSAAAEGFAALP